ncbi:MAG: radical SAM protein [Firmicutes bacterium]|jgi:radical SAM protein with 4Fe4S-binding SPASM domain|nr:radical SAM protein [Bacillota bacterium]
MLVGRTRFLPMESRSFVYSLAPDARVVRAGEAYLILNPAFGTWAKIGRYAGLMFERSLGINIQAIVDTVGPAYGREALVSLLELMEELQTRGLLVCEPSGGGTEAHKAETKSAGAVEARLSHSRVYVSVTDNCNLACATCYRGAREDDATTEAVLSTIGRLGMFSPRELVITGGEPTLRADLTELLQAATRVAPKVTLATNATLMTDAIAEAIASLGVRVQVSVDSADHAEHDAVRGEGSFYAALGGLSRLVRAGTDHVELVSTVVDPKVFDLEAMVSLAEKHGATFHVSLFQEVGRGACSRLTGRSGDPASLAKSILNYLLRACEANDFPEEASLEDVLGLVPREGCGAGSKVFAVSGSGNAYPCHLLMLPEFEATLNQIPGWKVPGVDDLEGCSGCDVRYFCGGGCRASAYSATGRLDGQDPMCEAYRIFISSILWTWDDSRTASSNLIQAISEVSKL